MGFWNRIFGTEGTYNPDCEEHAERMSEARPAMLATLLKRPVRYDANKQIIFDADNFVFLHRDGLGLCGLHLSDDDRAEFQDARAELLVCMINEYGEKI